MLKYEDIELDRISTDGQYRERLQYACQTDLLFLAKEILGYRDATEETHREVADTFLKKDPKRSIRDQDERRKAALLLLPRGTFKSTFNICDSVQYICCWPDIAILVLTAANSEDSPLADAFVDEVARHFIQPKDAAPTLFQMIFPHLVIAPRAYVSGWLKIPREHERREPTLMGSSIETSLSGWHFDVIKPEDIVDNRNSQTPAGLRKVKKNLFINLKMLMPWGFREMTGTRYNPNDVYGDIIEKADPHRIKILWKSAMTRKPESLHKNEEDCTEADFDLFFPKLLPYEFLMEKKEEDYDSFMTQYMNVAQGSHEVIFSKESLLASIVPAEQMPVVGETRICWRFPVDNKSNLTGVGAAVGIVSGGRLWVVELVRGSFKPSALAMKVVQVAKKHGAHTVHIEETPGAHYYEPAIKNYALVMGWHLDIAWIPYEEDDAVRSLRIKGIEPTIGAKRIVFSDGIGCLKEAIKQFTNFGMVDETELPDTISQVAEALPKLVQSQESNAEQDLNWEMARHKDMFDRIHGLGNYAAKVETAEENPYEAPTNSFGLDNMLGGLNG